MMVSSAYLRLLIFLPAIFIPTYASSSPAFLMMYSVYKLNKQGDNIVLMYSFSYWEPCCLEPCLESVFPCPVLTVASWPAYRFLKRQIRCPSLSGFSTVYCDPHKGFGIVNKAERDGFLEFSCFFDDPADVLVPLPFLNSAWTSGSSWFMYCWSLAWGILSITFLACEMSVIVQ